jgi:hypothetical protein
MTITDTEPKHRRRFHLPSLAFVLALCAVVALLATVGTVWLTADRDSKASEADAAKDVATDQATTLDQLCATDPDVARRIPEDCAEAREVREDVVLPASAPGPSQAEVQGWVDEWLDAHPPRRGRGATADMVARAVAEHMAGNGQERIANVARAYIEANAEQFRGRSGDDGSDGVDGQDATDDQVAAAVAAFCAERNSCQGPPGESVQGPQGQGVRDIRPERSGEGVCEWVIVFEDPASGEVRTVRHPAGDAACPAAPPPDDGPGGLLPGG